MSSLRPPEPRGRDLDDEHEVAELVTRFYREIAQDARFHRYFNELARVDWHAHTLGLTDYWVAMLFGTDHEPAGAMIERHRWLHDAEPFDGALFERWLTLFDEAVDGGWAGPVAEQAKKRARGLVWAMAHRFGVDGDGAAPADPPGALVR